jgi:hypothetical protein
MAYSINPQSAQDDIAAHLRAMYPHVPVIEDGLLDDETSTIQRYANGSIKPFIVIWFETPRRTNGGRSVATTRLDQRKAAADLVVVAKSGPEARRLANDLYDKIIGFKPIHSSIIVESERQLWSGSRQIDSASKPSRWAMPISVEWGAFAQKTP